jgi:hypothetical protein
MIIAFDSENALNVPDGRTIRAAGRNIEHNTGAAVG